MFVKNKFKLVVTIRKGKIMADLTVLILAHNEEKNIERCIKEVKSIAKRIIVVDSGSTDRTVEIAGRMGAEVLYHPWKNYATQYNWGIQNASIRTKWIFRLDADEFLTNEAREEIETLCKENENTDVNGLVVRFTVSFLGRELKHGGIYPFRKLLIYKTNKGFMEERNMDEHIVLKEGRSIELQHDCIHQDFKDLTAWIDKHNKYSSREVLDYFESIQKESSSDYNKLDKKARFKRYVKFGIYYKLPLGMRAFLYYCYRYYFKFGFLDGKEGKIFAFLQAYWYRFLVDAKIYEAQISEKKE